MMIAIRSNIFNMFNLNRSPAPPRLQVPMCPCIRRRPPCIIIIIIMIASDANRAADSESSNSTV
jgi:hypothetical protein